MNYSKLRFVFVSFLRFSLCENFIELSLKTAESQAARLMKL
jgi:hypothetical protein